MTSLLIVLVMDNFVYMAGEMIGTWHGTDADCTSISRYSFLETFVVVGRLQERTFRWW